MSLKINQTLYVAFPDLAHCKDSVERNFMLVLLVTQM